MSDAPDDPKKVGERIRALRMAHGLNGREFADAIGVLPGEVGAWESGGRRPSVAKVRGMIQIYKITLDWLFLGDPRHLPHDLATRISAIVARNPEGSPQDQG